MYWDHQCRKKQNHTFIKFNTLSITWNKEKGWEKVLLWLGRRSWVDAICRVRMVVVTWCRRQKVVDCYRRGSHFLQFLSPSGQQTSELVHKFAQFAREHDDVMMAIARTFLNGIRLLVIHTWTIQLNVILIILKPIYKKSNISFIYWKITEPKK